MRNLQYNSFETMNANNNIPTKEQVDIAFKVFVQLNQQLSWEDENKFLRTLIRENTNYLRELKKTF